MTAPMTAAEYRAITKGICDVDPIRRTLAALEEREALLGRVAVLTDERDRARKEAAEVRRLSESDASVGALVRRILDHPEAHRGHYFNVLTRTGTWTTSLTEQSLTDTLAHLDSLLPKEPEVVTGPSGWSYQRVADGKIRQTDHFGGTLTFYGADHENVPPCDAPVVAKLMGLSGEAGK